MDNHFKPLKMFLYLACFAMGMLGGWVSATAYFI